jgi:RNA polymerase sigma factor (sigma-70 family)
LSVTSNGTAENGRPTDVELVDLARGGDKDAFGELAQRYQSIAKRFATRLTANNEIARELAQEAIVQAYLSLPHLRDPARFKGWLCGIVLNVFRNHLRQKSFAFSSWETVAGDLPLDAVSPATVDIPEAIAEEQELSRIVMDGINALSTRDRDAALLFYYRQMSVQETATRLGISVGTVKVSLHRARERLRVWLISNYPDLVPKVRRRKVMVKVSIADVVRQQKQDSQGRPSALHIILLKEDEGQRVLPIFVGPFEGQSIAVGLAGFSTPRPTTFKFMASLLAAANAQVEQVCVETLKATTFYAVVKVRRGKTVSEVDARPSDAIALAVLTGSLIFVAEDVLETAGASVPGAPIDLSDRKGVASVLEEVRETQRRMQADLPAALSQEDAARARDELIAAVLSR